MSHVEGEVCLDCDLVNAVGTLLDAGATPAHIWEIVKDTIEEEDGSR